MNDFATNVTSEMIGEPKMRTDGWLLSLVDVISQHEDGTCRTVEVRLSKADGALSLFWIGEATVEGLGEGDYRRGVLELAKTAMQPGMFSQDIRNELMPPR